VYFVTESVYILILDVGVINEDRLRELLTTMGDRFTDDEVSWSSHSHCQMCLLSVLLDSFHFNSHFPGELWLAGVY